MPRRRTTHAATGERTPTDQPVGEETPQTTAPRSRAREPSREASRELRHTLHQLSQAEIALRRQNDEITAARETIEAERERYRELFEFAPDAYLVTDLTGNVLEANHAAGHLLEIAIPDLVRKPLAGFLPPREHAQFRHVLSRLARERSIKDWRMALHTANGDRRHVSATVALGHSHSFTSTNVRWLLRDISEQVHTEDEIRLLNETLEQRVRERTAELEQANAAKDDFLGMVSHELNTPITTIMGNAEVLARRIDQIEPKMRAAALGDIKQEAERLHQIIDNMLVLARLARGQEIGREPLMVQHLVREVCERHQREHPARKLVVDIEGRLPPVTSAPVYVRQVLANLLSNAEKYSPAHLPVEVSARLLDDAVEVSVRDHGTGLSSEEIDEIFTPFYRSPRTASHAPGIGIGLSVCKRLIEAQGGRIRAKAQPGGGLVVAFALPVDHESDDARA